MIYKTVYKKGNKFLAKIIFDDVGEKWCSTTSAVYNFAQKNFEEDEEVDVEYSVKNGQYSVSKIMKVGGGSKKTEKKEEETMSKFACEDCGATLKEGKYKKCYTCNKKTPSKPKTEGYTCSDCGAPLKDNKYEKCYTCNQKNPVASKKGTTDEAIRKEAVLKASCDAVKTLAGFVQDPDTLANIVESLYDRLYKKLFG